MTVPLFVLLICGASSGISIVISMLAVYLQLANYRKPFEQRLIVRIQLMVPLYLVTCFVSLYHPPLGKFIEPIREIYELFVIYTFFNLLTEMLGGERNILHFTLGRPPVEHPSPTCHVLDAIDISDPYHFVLLKRGVLQYVWLKPILCATILTSEFFGVYDVNDLGLFSVYLWTTIIYNMSVTVSLYCLAMFWKCLYADLKPFNPWGKFLCVKLIIFASYWQGVILLIANYLGLFPEPTDVVGAQDNMAISIQNLVLCVELIFFSLGHWYSFDYKPFNKRNLPNCAKLHKLYLFKDCIGIVDLWCDFKNSSSNEFWSYRHFDSVENLIAEERSKIKRINQGMRYSNGGTQKYWLPKDSMSVNDGNNSDIASLSNNNTTDDQLFQEAEIMSQAEFDKDDKLYNYAKRHYPFGDPNYPVEIEMDSYMYSKNFQTMRQNMVLKYDRSANNNNNQAGNYGSI